MAKTHYINPRFYQNEKTISLNPSKPFNRKRRKPKNYGFLKSLILVLVIFSVFIGYSAYAEDYYCKQKHVIGFKGIPESDLKVIEFEPRDFEVDTTNPEWNCEYPEGEDFLYCADYFSQFIMQKETKEFTLTYHNGLIKNAQDNLYVGYGQCMPRHDVPADIVVG